MRDVIDAHVVLLKIARLPGMGVLEPDPHDVDHLENMLAYLVALQDEYRDRYKRVSSLQRYDEEVTKQQFAAEAKRLLEQDDRVDHVPPQPSERAWKLLHSSRTFPVLDDLCSKGPEYQSCFLVSCAALSVKLANAKATGRLPAPGQQLSRGETELRRNVNVKADATRERCAKAAQRDSEQPEDARAPVQVQP